MTKTPVNWMGDSRPTSKATAGAFRELERTCELEAVRQRLRMQTSPAGGSLFSSAWKTFAAAFVVLMLASQFVPMPSGVHVVMEARRLADPIFTSSN
jgi:hypothetical protein